MDIVMISDIIPTGFHGATCAGVKVGSSVYIAGAGPVGISAVIGCRMLGASIVFVGDMKPERLALAKKVSPIVHPVNLKEMDIADVKKYVKSIIGTDEVDCVVDAVGYEATGHKRDADKDDSMAALNSCIAMARTTAQIGIPGAYFVGDPGGKDDREKKGQYTCDFGDLWMKSLSLTTGQTPVQRYNRNLLNMILYGGMRFSELVNGRRISLNDAPEAFKRFAAGEAAKYVIDPHLTLGKTQPL
jgi:glutathione-independent formaldehyde dehydrogenase